MKTFSLKIVSYFLAIGMLPFASIKPASLLELQKQAAAPRAISLLGYKYLDLSNLGLESLEGLESCEDADFLNLSENPLRDVAAINSCKKLKLIFTGDSSVKDKIQAIFPSAVVLNFNPTSKAVKISSGLVMIALVVGAVHKYHKLTTPTDPNYTYLDDKNEPSISDSGSSESRERSDSLRSVVSVSSCLSGTGEGNSPNFSRINFQDSTMRKLPQAYDCMSHGVAFDEGYAYIKFERTNACKVSLADGTFEEVSDINLDFTTVLKDLEFLKLKEPIKGNGWLENLDSQKTYILDGGAKKNKKNRSKAQDIPNIQLLKVSPNKHRYAFLMLKSIGQKNRNGQGRHTSTPDSGSVKVYDVSNREKPVLEAIGCTNVFFLSDDRLVTLHPSIGETRVKVHDLNKQTQ